MASDPLDTLGGPDTFWTRVNAAEALPGVITPLTWTFYARASEVSVRTAFAELGVLRRAEIGWPRDPDQRFIGVFHGRAAINLDQFRAMADRSPGQSGDALEREFFGTVRPGVTSAPMRRRYPVVAVRTPRAARSVNRRLLALQGEADAWWRQVVARPSGDPAGARAVLRQAAELYTRVMVPHTIGTMLAPALFSALAQVATAAGHPGLELRLVTGQSIHETAWLDQLWQIAHGQGELATFVADHGYHGPDEGELSAHPWREDDTPLRAMAERFRTMPAQAAPAAVERRRAAEAAQAQRILLAALPAVRRPGAHLLLRLVRHFVPLRETGRSSFLRAVDGGRLAARSLGASLHADGLLKDPEDVFFLTMAELTGPLPVDAIELVQERRARFEEYRTQRLPDAWTGRPEPLPTSDDPSAGPVELSGFAVSPGVVEGPARVIERAEALDELEPGEILVCPLTDPSWSLGFVVAAGLAIDVGGPLSHGAIVARELGVPCVINTRDGSRLLRTGDRVRLDGGAGTVTRI
ncbi:MAG TPA: PEP-utilizing enzyme [Sporichthyaceae bacterium]|nr:PEP-utilizing enzyme [Sporichthyaceae bacterium]